MNRLLPLITHSSPSRRAVVATPPRSEPASGSVAAIAPSRSPAATSRSTPGSQAGASGRSAARTITLVGNQVAVSTVDALG